MDRWAYMLKLIVAFHSFANTPKNCWHCLPWRVQVNDIVSSELVVKVLSNNYRSKKRVQRHTCFSIYELLNKSGKLIHIFFHAN
jgi:hypothetical protein